MITKARISNFRHIEDIEAPLGRLNLIVGPNGCGKSSFLKAIETALLSTKSSSSSENGRERLNFSLDLVGSSDKSNLSCIDGSSIKWERVGTHGLEELDAHLFLAPSLVPVKFEISKMRMPIGANNDPDRFDSNGANLTAAIASTKLNNNSVFDKIRNDLQVVVPSIIDIKVVLINGFFNLRFDTKTAQNLDVNFMSDGTLFTLGLLTFLHMVGDRNALFLIDDLDQGLHPLAQKELVTLLRLILKTNENYQIIATSHSPYLVACMKPEEVLCMHLGDDGLSRMAPLTAHPDFDRWKDEMNPGEFWSLFGDDWVAIKGAV